MNHHKPPTVSKKQVNRAGDVLKSAKTDTVSYKEALEIANQWRLAHVYPINTFQARLRKMVAKFPGSIVAQRLKRMPTIIDKLDRHQNMKLSTMQDIGGVRAVLPSISDVYELVQQYESSKRFTHILKDKKDYIASPKRDGYRGIHLIYRYNNTLARNGSAALYSGLMVEVQIRTKEQHIWATAVETMGTILDQPFKTRGGVKDWSEFFALMSSAIAIVEATSVLEEHENLQPAQIYQQIATMAQKIRALDLVSGYSHAANIIEEKYGSGFYNLIALNTKDRTINIKPYAKKDYEKAVADYSRREQSSEDYEDVVLVSAGKLKSLKQAYPNYFLDMRNFLERIAVIISEVAEVDVRQK